MPGLEDIESSSEHDDKLPTDHDCDYDLPLMIPYEESFDDDDYSDLSLPDDARFIESGWASECLHDSEDIDFEFVYALHTFVATVEGQANATKGDTMVLLDDSNSYWWLVRVVKDSSIGYLPAEHIETPTERLARLNKHRNIDLSAAMLGDQAPRQKPATFNSIVKRKKATVAFAEPTYFDYSDFDYSTDEDDIDELFGPDADRRHEDRARREQKSAQASDGSDSGARVEPLRTRSSSIADSTKSSSSEDDGSRSSNEILDEKSGRSKHNTTKSTDSFFGDEETKKITLTPNLLRDDNGRRTSNDSLTKDGKTRTSLEKLERELVSDKERKKLSKDKDKKDKDKEKEREKEKEKEKEREREREKEKERERERERESQREREKEKDKDKKPSAIRSFFSRKDKRRATDGDSHADAMSEHTDSEERLKSEPTSPEGQGKPQRPQRGQAEPAYSSTESASVQLSSYLAEGRINNVSNMPPTSMRIVNPRTNETKEVPSAPQQLAREISSREQHKTASPQSLSIRTGSGLSDSRPQQAGPAVASRFGLDVSEISDDEGSPVLVQHPAHATGTSANRGEEASAADPVQAIAPGATPESTRPSEPAAPKTVTPRQSLQSPLSRYAESPASVSACSSSSPVASAHPPALINDTDSPEDRSPTASPSPELVQSVADALKGSQSPSSSKEPVWDDSKLRAFFDESDHIRDLLTVVYDKSDVVAEGYDHPIVGGLFREQNAKLAEITTQLDNMLGDWLARKQRLRGTI
ncbi:Tip elongation aberrant protein Tea4 [Escovopsis weberi]|uniref:Tip elongation aberrant protein Tea4 n=1 Tax=Escovopsis weberi TaxID=150374 RepID=A0A0M8N6N6_ESCWE|nr:Tip elongation aberrant protein Tea4 [Escovopsis weberi]